ncbi:MAG: DNA alkylation repair protein [Alloprevotella sp.]|nr:DNA alkylation repair protein [Alloprevotella sp.]
MEQPLSAETIIQRLENLADEEQSLRVQRYFKTDRGDYGEGDIFLGVKLPEQRRLSGEARLLPLDQIEKLIRSPYHEVRACGFQIYASQFKRLTSQIQRGKKPAHEATRLLQFYLKHANRCNNWDLVDTTCPHTLGQWLMLAKVPDSRKWKVLDQLAHSPNLWRKRISMVSTLTALKGGRADFTLHYAEVHLHHPHDLMHKAVGWMLREMGKHCGEDLLRAFLDNHYHTMPRTALRYAIEKLPETERQYWLKRKLQ